MVLHIYKYLTYFISIYIYLYICIPIYIHTYRHTMALHISSISYSVCEGLKAAAVTLDYVTMLPLK